MLESASDGVDKWMREVRDPAAKASEGKRRLESAAAAAEYEVAPLPDGRWAVRYSCRLEFASGTNCPWRAFPTREECLAYFLHNARKFFELEDRLKGGREAARRKVLGLLTSQGLFSWEEPKPEK